MYAVLSGEESPQMSQSNGPISAVRNQTRAALLALGLIVAALWVSIPMGEWRAGVFLGVGVLLGLVNHVLTELFLLRSVQADDMITRKQYAVSSLVRLLGISLVAITLAVVFWPDGATVLLGLALFHLLTLVLTGIPLLKEIKKA
jgi:hypothetical protein